MKTISEWKDYLSTEAGEARLATLYGRQPEKLTHQQLRYQEVLDCYKERFGNVKVQLFSVPGRVELSGNHTDHNNGRVLAASVNLDAVAAAEPASGSEVVVHSAGFPTPFIVDLDRLEMNPDEAGTTTALIRGLAARLHEGGYRIGGFHAYIHSQVLPGSGISSSAAVEILLASIFNHFFNNGEISPLELAQAGQFAENQYFGKPCGLMDQIACAMGGIVAIDFERSQHPVIEAIDFDFASQNYQLIVLDTGGNHADLTQDYASVPAEMKSVAQYFGKQTLRQVDVAEFLANIAHLRKKTGDRAILRACHYFQENERVQKQVSLLKEGRFLQFLEMVNASGRSSWQLLQNCYTTQNVREQGIALALALTEDFLRRNDLQGACRVHGGGFAGTILAFIPRSSVPQYRNLMSTVFGDNSVTEMTIRNQGVYVWND